MFSVIIQVDPESLPEVFCYPTRVRRTLAFVRFVCRTFKSCKVIRHSGLCLSPSAGKAEVSQGYRRLKKGGEGEGGRKGKKPKQKSSKSLEGKGQGVMS